MPNWLPDTFLVDCSLRHRISGDMIPGRSLVSFERICLTCFLSHRLQQFLVAGENRRNFLRRFASHGDGFCGTRGCAEPASNTSIPVDDSLVVYKFNGIHLAPVHAGAAGVAGILVFCGIVVGSDYSLQVAIFGEICQ